MKYPRESPLFLINGFYLWEMTEPRIKHALKIGKVFSHQMAPGRLLNPPDNAGSNHKFEEFNTHSKVCRPLTSAARDMLAFARGAR